MSQLRACPHCQRHHHVCEPVCPFCGGALPACDAAATAGPRGRMSRATLVATAAALLGAASCESGTRNVPLYGGPPVVTAQDGGADATRGE
jgi:hypothetical protein